MKLIYVSGPYTADTYEAIEHNIRKSEEVSVKLLKLGWCVITPHMNFAHYERYSDDLDYDFFMKADLEILKRCDAIFMMKRWQVSKGSNIELAFAADNGLTLYYETDGFPTLGA